MSMLKVTIWGGGGGDSPGDCIVLRRERDWRLCESQSSHSHGPAPSWLLTPAWPGVGRSGLNTPNVSWRTGPGPAAASTSRPSPPPPTRGSGLTGWSSTRLYYLVLTQMGDFRISVGICSCLGLGYDDIQYPVSISCLGVTWYFCLLGGWCPQSSHPT